MPAKAVLFDLDGVFTDTASAHANAWEIILNEFLKKQNQSFKFFQQEDYVRYIDGKTRLDGVLSFLRSRDIQLPLGPPDADQLDSVLGICNCKNKVYKKVLTTEGIKIFNDSLRLINTLRGKGVGVNLISSSKNARFVIKMAGLKDLFDVMVDGITVENNKISSKPNPEFYLYAAREVGRNPEECVVIEDAISGILSAKRARMYVIGIARSVERELLRENGADLVVSSLDELSIDLFETSHISELA